MRNKEGKTTLAHTFHHTQLLFIGRREAKGLGDDITVKRLELVETTSADAASARVSA